MNKKMTILVSAACAVPLAAWIFVTHIQRRGSGNADAIPSALGGSERHTDEGFPHCESVPAARHSSLPDTRSKPVALVQANSSPASRFVEGAIFDTATIHGDPTSRSVTKDGKVLLSFDDYIEKLRESPDHTMFLCYGPPDGWNVYQIKSSGCNKVAVDLPRNEDMELFWFGSRQLLGVVSIHEDGIRPGMENRFVEKTRLILCDIESGRCRDIVLPDAGLGKGELIRVDRVSADGHAMLSVVTPELYFDLEKQVRHLGVFKLAE